MRAHHCYREKPGDPDEEDLSGEDRHEAEKDKVEEALQTKDVTRDPGSASPFTIGYGYTPAIRARRPYPLRRREAVRRKL